jgi:hypothetical protein
MVWVESWGTAWSAAEGVAAAWDMAEVDEACDEEAANDWAIRPPEVAVRSPATVLQAV